MVINCEKDWIDVFSALLTPTIAIVVAIIAFLQWRTAEINRRQQLFDKRYLFFKELWRRYENSVTSGRGEELDVEDLFDMIHEAEFLFGKEIADHMMKIPDKKNVLNYDWFSEPFKKYMQLK